MHRQSFFAARRRYSVSPTKIFPKLLVLMARKYAQLLHSTPAVSNRISSLATFVATERPEQPHLYLNGHTKLKSKRIQNTCLLELKGLLKKFKYIISRFHLKIAYFWLQKTLNSHKVDVNQPHVASVASVLDTAALRSTLCASRIGVRLLS